MRILIRHLLQLQLLLLGACQVANALRLPKKRALSCDHSVVHANRPTVSDCGTAVRLFPHDTVEGIFHHNGADDHFRLPLMAIFGTCRAAVDLNAGNDSSNWRRISNAAVALKLACMESAADGPYVTGGWTTIGPEDGIIITLSKAQGLHGIHGSNRTLRLNGFHHNGSEAGYARIFE